ncbi:serine/threonine kinase 16 [Boeremia exigua]|uniref:serine/threonine kinase 16 n=1 Tax=Boeremia exigua TaxID=749465 RepID=UPI001E8CE472|nr:serine/threonine kinase 16 [Boeremia exigua]KAH6628974.1 serine/threonine kinase 16 [Boeremia exigua]
MSDQQAIPGTVHLVDIDGSFQAKHAGGNLRDIVLVPAPSNDPDDPLNWSKGRKLLSVVCMSMYMIATGIASSLMYSIIVPVSKDTGLSIAALNEGTGYNYLAFGWGCLLWQPAALQFGKRPIYLISLLMSIGITVAVPYARTQGTWIALKILGGLVGAPLECLGEISIADVFFSHERGTYLAAYSFTLYTAGFIAPILAGYITEGMGWRWVQNWGAIWLGIAFVFCFFFMEETNYVRASVLASETQNVINGIPTGPAGDENVSHISTSGEKIFSQKVDADRQNLDSRNLDVTKQPSNSQEFPTAGYRPRTYLQKLKMFDKARPITHFWSTVLRPLRLMRYPVILYCAFSYGGSLIWYSVLNATSSLILSAPPYNFSPGSVGLAYIACIVGVLIGSLLAGSFGDWIVIKIARRNKGIWESEYRQWLNLILALILPFSLILWGVGAANHIHWFGLVFAMGLTGLVVALGAHLSLSYCIDTYKDFGADAVVSVMCIRNTMGFAISYAVTPWVTNMGLQNAFLVAAFAGLAQVLTFLVFIKWGKAIRSSSAAQYRAEIERAERLGIAH